MLLFYCIFMWLLGGGMAYSFWQQDKKEGRKPKFEYVPIFVIFFPVIIPIILGLVIGDWVKVDENE